MRHSLWTPLGIVFLAPLLSSCITAPMTLSFVTGVKSGYEEQIGKLSADMGRKRLNEISIAWEGRPEKELIVSWGSPFFTGRFEGSETVYKYQSVETTTTTTGGDSVSKYDEFTKQTLTTKGSEVTTARTMQSVVTVVTNRGTIQEVTYDGYLGQLETLMPPPQGFQISDEYLSMKRKRDELQGQHWATTAEKTNTTLIIGGLVAVAECALWLAWMSSLLSGA